MDKFNKYLIWTGLFFLLSCSNLSRLCKHQFQATTEFAYQDAGNGNAYNKPVLARSVDRIVTGSGTSTAEKIEWESLKDLTWEIRYNKDYKIDMRYPVFGKTVKKLDGKELYISGYLIPLNPAAGLYALSKNNFASCFFCGRAGPESIISLKFRKTPRNYKTDEFLTMKGRMELNDSNIRDYIYIFRDTEEYKVP